MSTRATLVSLTADLNLIWTNLSVSVERSKYLSTSAPTAEQDPFFSFEGGLHEQLHLVSVNTHKLVKAGLGPDGWAG
jgi:hypothetical protein